MLSNNRNVDRQKLNKIITLARVILTEYKTVYVNVTVLSGKSEDQTL